MADFPLGMAIYEPIDGQIDGQTDGWIDEYRRIMLKTFDSWFKMSNSCSSVRKWNIWNLVWL